MMRRAWPSVLAVAAAIPLTLFAQDRATEPPEAQVREGQSLLAQARFREAAKMFRRVLDAPGGVVSLVHDARTGLVFALLRTGEFAQARQEAESLAQAFPGDAGALALYGDTLWSSGLFDEADREYDRALAADAGEARAHHGRARALIAHGRLDEAFIEATEAVRLAPAEGEFHHTVGVIYERQQRFSDAAAAYAEYLERLPDRDRSQKALWTRAEIRFLQSFGGRTPLDLTGSGPGPWTVPIRIEGGKALVSVGINGAAPMDFVLDTGAEQTVLSRELARRRGVAPITYVEAAGVGGVGLRGLQVGRIDTLAVGSLQMRNVPCLIKNPPLGGLPTREPDSFSPLALGLSMRIDYAKGVLVMARSLPDEPYATTLPLRMYRLAMVRGTINGRPASFVVDTGGEVISISAAMAGAVASASRRIPLKVYGMSGWDKDAFLLPNVNLEFSSVRLPNTSVVVLNLQAPSDLLGFEVGGIVGHRFLSQYRVSFDLQRSVLGLAGGSATKIEGQ